MKLLDPIFYDTQGNIITVDDDLEYKVVDTFSNQQGRNCVVVVRVE